MKLAGEQKIEVPRQRVWAALNDPDVLRQCIPGCQSLEREADDRLKATVVIKVGPISARFAGAVTLSDLDPPNAYTISGEGAGGAAGFAKGSARVRLAEMDGGTLLGYDVNAQVGGRLAQLGGPVIDATAKQLAGTFFKRFGEIVAQPVVEAAQRAVPSAGELSSEAESIAPRSSASSLAWIGALLLAALAGFLVGRVQGAAESSVLPGLLVAFLALVAAAVAYSIANRARVPLVQEMKR